MAIVSLSSACKVLSGLGIFLLWGNMALNGAMNAMLKTAGTGIFPDGAALKTSYTGVPLLDYMLSILVAFFYPIMTETAPYLVILDIVAAMLVINILVLVESRRPMASKWLRSPLQWQYQFNGAGVAVFLPIYSNLVLQHRDADPGPRKLDILEAQAVPFTALWSLFLPIPLLIPPIIGASPLQIQNGLVIYFFTPVLFALFHAVAARTLSSTTKERRVLFSQPVRTAYSIVGIASALIHVGIMAYALFSVNPSLSITALYYPEGSSVKREQPDILRAGGLLFSQWDLAITLVTMVLLAVSFQKPQARGAVSMLVLTGVAVILGPGAALAYSLYSYQDDLAASYGKGKSL
ncbi:unnamed protein product [Discula destructiva]